MNTEHELPESVPYPVFSAAGIPAATVNGYKGQRRERRKSVPDRRKQLCPIAG